MFGHSSSHLWIFSHNPLFKIQIFQYMILQPSDQIGWLPLPPYQQNRNMSMLLFWAHSLKVSFVKFGLLVYNWSWVVPLKVAKVARDEFLWILIMDTMGAVKLSKLSSHINTTQNQC